MADEKKLEYEYVWSLLDRLLVLFLLLTVLFILLPFVSRTLALSFGNHTLACLAIASFCAVIAFILWRTRKVIFSPASLFVRAREAVANTTIYPEKLSEREGDPNNRLENMVDLATELDALLGPIDDFYTCLLSPATAGTQFHGRVLADYGLLFGIKRDGKGLLALDEEGNILPDQDADGHPVAKNVLFESVAFRAKLKPFDVVLEIGGRSTAKKSFAQVNTLLKGQRGSIDVLLKRNNQKIAVCLNLNSPLVNKISSKSIEQQLGYLRIETFERVSAKNLENAVRNISNCSGFIVDLRANRGGDIRNALLLLSAFLDEGTLAYCERRDEFGEPCKLRYRLTESRILIEREDSESSEFAPLPTESGLVRLPNLSGGKPVVVLIDDCSMSGAELFAGAMRDMGRARLIGTRTFGKGVGQDVLAIPPCIKISVTSMRFTTPAGTWPGDGAVSVVNGIEPHIVLPAPHGVTFGGPSDFQLAKAIELLTEGSCGRS